ncbi:hypothetical protein EJ110_NYTH52181 [Nymphaea thermarum]|nr:hypothetical protein EJ110_NYTH52181 [Nymphaea thermarum]
MPGYARYGQCAGTPRPGLVSLPSRLSVPQRARAQQQSAVLCPFHFDVTVVYCQRNLNKGSTSIMDDLSRIKVVTDQLAASGNNISNKEKVQQTLSGHGHDCHAFIMALEVLPVLPSFNELQGKLLQHEMNMKGVIERTHQGNSQNVLAMNAKFGQNHGNSNQGGCGILPTPNNQGQSGPGHGFRVSGLGGSSFGRQAGPMPTSSHSLHWIAEQGDLTVEVGVFMKAHLKKTGDFCAHKQLLMDVSLTRPDILTGRAWLSLLSPARPDGPVRQSLISFLPHPSSSLHLAEPLCCTVATVTVSSLVSTTGPLSVRRPFAAPPLGHRLSPFCFVKKFKKLEGKCSDGGYQPGDRTRRKNPFGPTYQTTYEGRWHTGLSPTLAHRAMFGPRPVPVVQARPDDKTI